MVTRQDEWRTHQDYLKLTILNAITFKGDPRWYLKCATAVASVSGDATATVATALLRITGRAALTFVTCNIMLKYIRPLLANGAAYYDEREQCMRCHPV